MPTLPTYDDLLQPMLSIMKDEKEHSLSQLADALAKEFNISDSQRKELLPSGKYPIFRSRVSWAKTYLDKARLIETTKRAHYKITERGLSLLSEGHKKLDAKVLNQYGEFRAFNGTNKNLFDMTLRGVEAQEETAKFQKEWPISRLESMTLDEYTNLDRSTAFVYWIEALTTSAGSIWGGSAYKFLIYRRKNTTKKITDPTSLTDGTYAWWTKIGTTAEEAFATTKKEVIKIAKAATSGVGFSSEDSWFGNAVYWKIAHLYNPDVVLPIYKKEVLLRAAQALGMEASRKTPAADLHEYLHSLKPEEETTFDYASELWGKYRTESIFHIIESFLNQSKTDNLKTKSYPKQYQDLDVKVSFGKGSPSKIPFLGFTNAYNTIQQGIYPCYLYFKEKDLLILTYGISETIESAVSWPDNLLQQSIEEYFEEHYDSKPHRYGGAYVGHAYPDFSRIRIDELQSDLDEMIIQYGDIAFDDITNDLDTEESDTKRAIWLIAAGRKGRMWEEWQNEGIVTIGWELLGDLMTYDTKEDIAERLQAADPENSSSMNNNALACLEFSRSIKVGDYIVVKKGITTVYGIGEVQSNYIFDQTRKEHKHVRKIEWLNTGVWTFNRQLVLKTLTNITPYSDLSRELLDLLLPEEGKSDASLPSYSFKNLYSEVFFDKSLVDQTVKLLRYKKNIILQGPPGTGKTFLARRLAYAMMGEKDKSRVALVQFHQSYAYEDFIQGYRPTDAGKFQLSNGIFHRFCDRAKEQPGKDFFFIIDEINRGNLSKIFGELMMLIEHDKRGEDFKMFLTYNPKGAEFYIPKNLHIIGTMNTADRSLALVDYALRRRFAFIDLHPQFNSNLKSYLSTNDVNTSLATKIIDKLTALNNLIAKEQDLGPGFTIGHSYFCNIAESPDEDWFKSIVTFEIAPLLSEYWFDNLSKVETEKTKLLS